ncbi:unnamed protein product [Bursaphelenchus okinawaensis]|uniref:Uncharacterized protein n=1 Tax=Bursaphelenchus okinawaensis TaxID=465554 RepID=A0A811L284_9BILA|nr:unnamed protein product [Bursaphelenchus okinawaensis]CAG9117345.1 unnamed protein product [Bursaphelenchus okinawaensis]
MFDGKIENMEGLFKALQSKKFGNLAKNLQESILQSTVSENGDTITMGSFEGKNEREGNLLQGTIKPKFEGRDDAIEDVIVKGNELKDDKEGKNAINNEKEEKKEQEDKNQDIEEESTENHKFQEGTTSKASSEINLLKPTTSLITEKKSTELTKEPTKPPSTSISSPTQKHLPNTAQPSTSTLNSLKSHLDEVKKELRRFAKKKPNDKVKLHDDKCNKANSKEDGKDDKEEHGKMKNVNKEQKSTQKLSEKQKMDPKMLAEMTKAQMLFSILNSSPNQGRVMCGVMYCS